MSSCDFEHLTETTVGVKQIFEGRIINVHVDDVKLSDGSFSKREVVNHPGGVGILAKTPEGELLFVMQFRYPMKKLILEIPAGKLEKGEDPSVCAVRELKEETGAECCQPVFLGSFYSSPGFSDEMIYLYYASVTEMSEATPDEGEFIECLRYKVDDVLDMIDTGELIDNKTVTAILLARQKGFI
ncbi:MAG: NUDIX hydrolase [Clostridia bacterium]|jgi:ADP-ribose pyrophosphatase|nr:NUDIX hydrolase [Clostridia bacterium]MBQ5956437.1 NUDIX hydrolase [Clostridia bacterium]MBQ6003121.1 NUDIX hydrolase [Clostridia bacterium]MBR0438960.1 NUDIX hydrolase [Clostridia bacterium]MBR6135397.1 NUDIX hydrolase [Clostridia bacterium]